MERNTFHSKSWPSIRTAERNAGSSDTHLRILGRRTSSGHDLVHHFSPLYYRYGVYFDDSKPKEKNNSGSIDRRCIERSLLIEKIQIRLRTNFDTFVQKIQKPESDSADNTQPLKGTPRPSRKSKAPPNKSRRTLDTNDDGNTMPAKTRIDDRDQSEATPRQGQDLLVGTPNSSRRGLLKQGHRRRVQKTRVTSGQASPSTQIVSFHIHNMNEQFGNQLSSPRQQEKVLLTPRPTRGMERVCRATQSPRRRLPELQFHQPTPLSPLRSPRSGKIRRQNFIAHSRPAHLSVSPRNKLLTLPPLG